MIKKHAHKIPHVVVPLVLFLCIYFLFTLHARGILLDKVKLQEYIAGYGVFAPLVLMLVYILFTMFPIVPSTAASIISFMLFGPVMGFVYSYVATVIGSIINFSISKKFGKGLVVRIIGEKKYEDYVLKYGNHPKYTYIFAFMIFIPLAPDDILSYFTGLTSMSYKKFITIILLCKPFGAFLYALGAIGYFNVIS